MTVSNTSDHPRFFDQDQTLPGLVALDWHNDMSRFILDANERIEAAADDQARSRRGAPMIPAQGTVSETFG
jgi:hypothetical protein